MGPGEGAGEPPWAEMWALRVLFWAAQLRDEARSAVGWGGLAGSTLVGGRVDHTLGEAAQTVGN